MATIAFTNPFPLFLETSKNPITYYFLTSSFHVKNETIPLALRVKNAKNFLISTIYDMYLFSILFSVLINFEKVDNGKISPNDTSDAPTVI